MLFSEPVFLFTFLPILLLVYFCTPQGLRNILLLCASILFYAWGEKVFVLVILASIAFNYLLALALGRAPSRGRANALLAIAVSCNLALLIACKYAAFLVANVNDLLLLLRLSPMAIPSVHLPLGVSFFTFQAMSYVVDVYRGEVKPQRNLVDFALYIALFPRLIAGPIVRYQDIEAELASRRITRAGFADGIRRFVGGLGKKVILADSVALVADRIFAASGHHLSAGAAWLGAVSYTLQIYFDFSGYSDMAIGLGRMFGFSLPENFNYPYTARSLTEFWRRWHMSLSTWFRDYLYIPLGGNRCKPARVYANLVTVFLLCGLWHGASWTFVVWGLFHGGFLLLERAGMTNWITSRPGPLKHVYLLLIVTVGWVFFRCDTLGSAVEFLKAMAGFSAGSEVTYTAGLYLNAELALVLAVGVIGSTRVLAPLGRGLALLTGGVAASFRAVWGMFVQFAALTCLSLIFLYSVMLMAAHTYSPFLYVHF